MEVVLAILVILSDDCLYSNWGSLAATSKVTLVIPQLQVTKSPRKNP